MNEKKESILKRNVMKLLEHAVFKFLYFTIMILIAIFVIGKPSIDSKALDDAINKSFKTVFDNAVNQSVKPQFDDINQKIASIQESVNFLSSGEIRQRVELIKKQAWKIFNLPSDIKPGDINLCIDYWTEFTEEKDKYGSLLAKHESEIKIIKNWKANNLPYFLN